MNSSPGPYPEPMEKIYDMLIIGGGPAGYTAALYAARAGLQVIVLEKLSAGGQMALSHDIDNYPGFEDGIDGFTLADKMQSHAERFGAETALAEVTGLELAADVKIVRTTEGIYRSKTVVLATGANPRPLGLPEEKALIGRGIHYCAACDGMRFRNKTVLVVGGGNSAVAEALALSRVAKEVILIHRRDTLRATKIYHEPLEKADNITVRYNSAVASLHHDGKLTGAVLRDTVTGEETAVDCDGIFVSIGRVPATDLVKGQLDLDKAGYVRANESTRTNIPGVFAIGDIRTKALRQVITAAADGAVAVHYAEEYLAAL